jgi:phosphate transport system protein
MQRHFDQDLDKLKEMLLKMASHAEQAVLNAIKALTEQDDEVARRVKEDDSVLDKFEKDIDELAISLLALKAPLATDLRLITVAMKISHDLERVGDEATTIARRALELNKEAQLKPYVDIPRMAQMGLSMLHAAIDSFVNRDPGTARAIIPRD